MTNTGSPSTATAVRPRMQQDLHTDPADVLAA
jgi:hypothetical protein